MVIQADAVHHTGLQASLSESTLLEEAYRALQGEDTFRAEQLFRSVLQADVRSAAAWRGLAETQVGARRGMCLHWAEVADAAQSKVVPRHIIRTRRRLRTIPRVGLVSALSATAVAVILVGSDMMYQDRMLPRVQVGTLAVGSLPIAEAQRLIEQQQAQIRAQVLAIRIEQQTWRVPLARFIPNSSPDLSQAAFAYGHDASFWQRSITRVQALTSQPHTINAIAVDEAAVGRFVADIAAQVQQDRRDAQLLYRERTWRIVPEQVGRSIDQPRTIAQLTQLLESYSAQTSRMADVLNVAMIMQPPTRTAAQFEPLRQRLEQLAQQPLELRSGAQRWVLDRSVLVDADILRESATIAPSDAAIEQQLAAVAAAVAVAPQPSQLVREGQRVRLIVPGKAGRELDRSAALTAIRAALIDNAPSVDVQVREIAPPPGEAEQLGLIAELGRGESQFVTYTSPARDANVQTGGRDIDGVLIAPGEVFSFTQTVGDIAEAKGYRWGEAITAGVVVPSLGGGICQVSTTVFRAAFWSGLEIVERSNHSLRLPWYEVDAPVGMDATVAWGGPDLKFRNNTSRYILLKVETDLARKRQTVIVYGTPDGRKVEMQARSGGNIAVERHVVQANRTITDDVFTSYYAR